MKSILKTFKTIDSTNTYALEHASEFDPSLLTVLYGEEQTKARGRAGRKWISGKGVNLNVTFCSFHQKPFPYLHNFAQVLSLSALEAVLELGLQPQLKWPNDLLLNGKKLAGVLTETLSVEDNWMVASGLGINVNLPLEGLKEVSRPATSLLQETGTPHSIPELLESITAYYKKNLAYLTEEEFPIFLNYYKRHLLHSPGDLIEFHVDEKVTKGHFHSISDQGTLQMKLPSGEIATFLSGDLI